MLVSSPAGLQNRRAAEPQGCRNAGLQKRRDAETQGCRTAGMQNQVHFTEQKLQFDYWTGWAEGQRDLLLANLEG